MIIISVLFAACLHDINAYTSTKFRAAVFEYAPIGQADPGVRVSRKEALDIMQTNIDVFEKQVKTAVDKESDIIVFPELGLFGYDLTRDSIKPYLGHVPQLEWLDERWCPCVSPTPPNRPYKDYELLRRLSCISWQYRIYLVVNIGSKEECDQSRDAYCPSDGQYQYNSNVVFDKEGYLIAHYRKYYLYWQPQYDRPPRQDIVTFQTEFGLFGTFTAGDIFYRRPAYDLVKRCGVKSLVVPMTWDNTFSFPLAIEVQQGFAMSMGVNLIVANTVAARYKIGGSGIYGSKGAVKYHYNRRSNKAKLIVADLPVYPDLPNSFHVNTVRQRTTEKEPSFPRIISGNKFKLLPLVRGEAEIKICDGAFCCNLVYKINRANQQQENFVLGVFNGRHTKLIDLDIQVCGLIKCVSGRAKSCGRRTFTSHTIFSKLILWGTFDKPSSVFPLVLLNGMSLGDGDFKYAPGMIYSQYGFRRPIIDVGLLGRNFAKDPTIIPLPANRTINPIYYLTSRIYSLTTSVSTVKIDKKYPTNIGPRGARLTPWTLGLVFSLTVLHLGLFHGDIHR